MSDAEVRPAGPSEPEFRKVLRGWDPEDVRTHLGIVASEIRDLQSKIQTLEAELEDARAERDRANAVIADPYSSASGHVAGLLRDLDQHVANVREEADAEAHRIRSEALAFRSSTLEDLRAMRDHMASSLKELEIALEVEQAPKAVVTLPEIAHDTTWAGAPAEGTATDPTTAM